MPQVTITIPFTYHHQDGTLEPIAPGTYDFSDAMANDAYVLYHSDNRPYVPPKPGTPEFAQADYRRRVRRKLLAAHAEELEDAQREQQENIQPLRQRMTPQVPQAAHKPPKGGTKVG